MSSTAVGSSRRAELEVAAAVIAVAAGAWAYTADRMAGMASGPGAELGGLGWFAVSWLVMMAAMMLPAIVPAAVACARRSGGVGEAGQFVAGYLAVWLAVGLVAYVGIEAVRSLHIGLLAWGHAGRWLSVAVLAGAGLYQLTPAKDACLRRCRDRLTILRDRRHGGVGIGIAHGISCAGCSWLLMTALFALGVMSVTWMIVVAALIVAERLLPRPAPVVVALILLALAVGVAIVPRDVPALTVPGSQPMQAMGMR